MNINYQKGFTLIELLVVIAIIGILASVILASLNTARAKGADAAVKAELSNARAQAEIYYDGNNLSYSGVCLALGTATPAGVKTILLDAAAKSGSSLSASTATAQTSTKTICNDNASSWVASAPLKSTTGYWCVDAKGSAELISGSTGLAGGAMQCP